MNEFNFAASVESIIRQELEVMNKRASADIQPFLAMVSSFQVEFELLLDRAQYTNVDTGSYPAVEAVALLGTDSKWQEILQNFGRLSGQSAANLAALWTMQAMTEKSGQFYLQAAANSAHPKTRLFFSSMAEAKNMLRRRFDAMLRILYNQIWADIGFAPFILGKD